MDFKKIFGNNKKQPQTEYFLAVEIHESLIKSVCWQVVDGDPDVIQLGSFEAWEDEESLINGVDASITEAVKNIGAQPRRVILGLPESWFEENSIHSTKKGLIKHLLDSLALEAIGVVSTTQAITHYLKKKEGIPPTAILLEIFQSKVVVSVVKLGKVEATEEVGVSGDLARDVEEGLVRMEFDSLPARFILTDGSSLDEEQQSLISYPWQEKLPFIHMPKVEVLPVDFSIKAVAMTGGTEAAETIGVTIKEDVIEESLPKESSNISIPKESESPDLANLGFSYEETSAPEEIPQANTDKAQSDSLTHLVTDETGTDQAEYALPQEEVEKHHPSRGIIQVKPSALIKKLNLKLPNIKLGVKPPLVIGAIFLILLVGLSFGGYFFLGSANITIYIAPQKLEKEIDIAISDTNQDGVPTLIATKKNITGTAKETISTTGEAVVGEKSQGTITIANRTVAPIALKSGSVITTDNGKTTFSIQEAVTVASASSDFNGTTFGKATGVKVVATKIGAESNLNKDTTFSVDNYSKTIVNAIAEVDFTGGNSKTVRAVSKIDQEKLIAQASEKIKQQTEAELSETDPNLAALSLNELTFTKKEFDKDVGEEATTVTLDMSGSVDLLVYSKTDIFNLIQSQIKEQLPIGSVLNQDGTEIKVENPVKNKDSYLAKAIVKASIIPEFNQADWINLIKGKQVLKAKSLFERINGYKNFIIRNSPPIPFISSTYIPFNNITIEISSR